MGDWFLFLVGFVFAALVLAFFFALFLAKKQRQSSPSPSIPSAQEILDQLAQAKDFQTLQKLHKLAQIHYQSSMQEEQDFDAKFLSLICKHPHTNAKFIITVEKSFTNANPKRKAKIQQALNQALF